MITPTYRRIVTDIREQIRSGQLKPGDKLPTFEQLREQYAGPDGHPASTTAVRNAMLILRNEGLIEGHQGKGVYVATPPIPTG